MKFENLTRVLTEYAELIRDKYKEELQSLGINASKSLSNSVAAVFTVNGTVYEASLSLNDYYKYIEGGRPPTKNDGNGELRRAILQWIKVKPVLPTPYNGKLPTQEQLAYLISRKIHMLGYEGKHPLKNVLEREEDNMLKNIEQAITEDINKELDEILFIIK